MNFDNIFAALLQVVIVASGASFCPFLTFTLSITRLTSMLHIQPIPGYALLFLAST